MNTRVRIGLKLALIAALIVIVLVFAPTTVDFVYTGF